MLCVSYYRCSSIFKICFFCLVEKFPSRLSLICCAKCHLPSIAWSFYFFIYFVSLLLTIDILVCFFLLGYFCVLYFSSQRVELYYLLFSYLQFATICSIIEESILFIRFMWSYTFLHTEILPNTNVTRLCSYLCRFFEF